MPAAAALIAACHMSVLYPSVDSSHFYFPANEQDLSPEFYVKHILEEKCPGAGAEIIDTKCRRIDTDNEDTKSCVTYTSVGYFMTFQDIMRNTHVVFSRWD